MILIILIILLIALVAKYMKSLFNVITTITVDFVGNEPNLLARRSFDIFAEDFYHCYGSNIVNC